MTKIPTRSRHCCQGEEPFEPGCSYISTLQWEKGEWIRLDYCPACFEEKMRTSHTWKGEIPPRKEKKLSPDEEAYDRFCTLHRENSSPELLYLLALYLERKKMLTRCGPNLFEQPGSGETFEVKACLVNDQAKEELQKLFHA